MEVKGSAVVGCTHQMPAFANSTICWPARAPVTRPAMGTRLSGPPSAAGGITLNSIDGLVDRWLVVQPLRKASGHVANANAKIHRAREFARDHVNLNSSLAPPTPAGVVMQQ